MGNVTVTLKKGFKVGEVVHLEAELREASSGDILDAMEESEKLVMVPTESGGTEPTLVASPTLVGIHTLRRQIVRIGEYQGPMTLVEIKKLVPYDLNLLQIQVEILETAGLKELSDRGRDSGGAGSD